MSEQKKTWAMKLGDLGERIGKHFDNAKEKVAKTWKEHKVGIITGTLVVGAVALKAYRDRNSNTDASQSIAAIPDNTTTTQPVEENDNYEPTTDRDMTMHFTYDDTGEEAPGTAKCAETFYKDMIEDFSFNQEENN